MPTLYRNSLGRNVPGTALARHGRGRGAVRTLYSTPLGLEPRAGGTQWGAGWALTAFPLEGNRDQEEEEDYENMAPPYKDLPPKPGERTSQRPVKRCVGWGWGGGTAPGAR